MTTVLVIILGMLVVPVYIYLVCKFGTYGYYKGKQLGNRKESE